MPIEPNETTSGIPSEILDKIGATCSVLAAEVEPYVENSLAARLYDALCKVQSRANEAD